MREKPDGSFEYVIVEVKATQGTNAGGLNTLSDDATQQMSEDWIRGRLGNSGLSDEQLADITSQLNLPDGTGNVALVKADVTGVDVDAPEGSSNGDITLTTLRLDGDQNVNTDGIFDPGAIVE